MSKDKLHNLIKSLSPSEKRYFKVNSLQNGSEKIYVTLFDLFDKNEKISSSDFRKLKSKFPSKTLPPLKDYLFHQILKSLRSYHSKHKIELQLYNQLEEIEILKTKGLNSNALSLINKGINLTNKFHLPEIGLLFLQKKASILLAFKANDRENEIKNVDLEINDIRKKAINHSKLYFEILLWAQMERQNRGDKGKQEYLNKKWENTKTELPQFSNLTFYSKTYYLNIESKKSKLENRISELDKHSEKLIHLWKSHPHIIQQKPHEYLIYANNYLTTCAHLNHWHKFPPLLEELKQLPIRDFNQAGEAFQVIAFKELYYLMNTKQFEKAEKTVSYIEEGLEKYKAKVHDARRLTFYYNISILYMMMKKYDPALDWMLKIVNYQKTEHRLDLQRIAPFFELIYHYNLGNLLLVNSKITTLRIRLRRKGKLSDWEKSVLTNLKKLCGKIDKSDIKAIKQTFLSEMEHLLETQPGLGVEECVIWLREEVS